MTTKIGGIVVDIDARLTNLEKSLAKADRDFKKFGSGVKSQGQQIQGSLGVIEQGFGSLKAGLVGIVAGFGLESLATLGRQSLQLADDLATAAERANVNVERFQSLREVFRVAEVDGDKFDKALARLNTTMGDVLAGSTDGATKALDRMGISSKILSGEITTTDQIIDAIAASSKDFGTQAEFAAAVVDIFGRKLGTDLTPALLKGADGFSELEQAAIDAGLVLDEYTINKLADANEAIDRFAAQSKVTFATWAGAAINAFENAGFAAQQYGAIMRREASLANTIDLLTTPYGTQVARGRANAQGASLAGLGFISGVFGQMASKMPQQLPARALGGGGGGARRPSGGRGGGGGGGGSSRPQVSEEQKLLDAFKKQNEEMALQLELGRIRAFEGKAAAEVYKDTLEIEKEFAKLGPERTNQLKFQAVQLGYQEDHYKAIADILATGEIGPNQDKIETDLASIGDTTKKKFADPTLVEIERVATGFADMTSRVNSSLNGLASSIKSGDVLGIITGVADTIASIAGAINTGFGGLFKVDGAKASGGPVTGGKTYLVGEKGPELFTPGASGAITPNHRLNAAGPKIMRGSGGNVYHISGNLLTPEFWQQIRSMDAEAAMAGSGMAQTTIYRRAGRKLA